jgi:hypothetical protein
MYLKIKMILVSTVVFMATNVYACHDDFGTKGHHTWSKNSGVLQLTELTTISPSTTTWCELYTDFITNEYQYLAEQAAQGQGPHLVSLAQLMGCSSGGYATFAEKTHTYYASLFSSSEPPVPNLFREQLNQMIRSTPVLHQNCTLQGVPYVTM